MANRRISGSNYEYAVVDTLPGADGYFTNPVSPRELRKTKGEKEIFFSIREFETDLSAAPSDLSDVTVVLQFMCPGDERWQDYVPLDGSEFTIGNRISIADLGAGVQWRAGVTSAGYGSGSVVFGFDW